MTDILLEVEALANTVRVEEMLESACPEHGHKGLKRARECGCLDMELDAMDDRFLLPFKAFVPKPGDPQLDEFGHRTRNLIGRDIARINAASYPDLYGDWVYCEEYSR